MIASKSFLSALNSRIPSFRNKIVASFKLVKRSVISKPDKSSETLSMVASISCATTILIKESKSSTP